MKRALLFSGIAVLVLLVIGGVVFSLLSKQGANIKQGIEAATVDFAEGVARETRPHDPRRDEDSKNDQAAICVIT